MNILDLLFVAILLLAATFGFFIGFLRMFLPLLSWTAALLLGMKYMPLVMPLVRAQLSTQSMLAPIISFFIVFIPALALCAVVSYLMLRLFRAQNNMLDRLLGFGLGAVLGLLLAVTVVFLATLGRNTPQDSQLWRQSTLAQPLQAVVRWTSTRLLPLGESGDQMIAEPQYIVPESAGAAFDGQVQWLPERVPESALPQHSLGQEQPSVTYDVLELPQDSAVAPDEYDGQWQEEQR